MKKRTKAMIVIVAIIMVFSITSVAFADHTLYSGSMNTGFWSQSLNKLNDTEFVDNNSTCYKFNTTNKTSYRSSCWENKTTKISSNHNVYSGGRWWEYDPPEGSMKQINLKFENIQSYKVTITGGFWLYPTGTN